MASLPRRAMIGGVADTFESGDAIMAADASQIVQTWNAAAERLLGVPAADAIGRPCWEALGATGEDGSVICHPGCARARLSAHGHPVRSQRMLVRTGHNGKMLVDVATLSARDGGGVVCVHVLRDADAPIPAVPTRLTRRQREILALLADGRRAKQIATDLAIAEATVRNHIRAILAALRAGGQLEAVAEARRRRLV